MSNNTVTKTLEPSYLVDFFEERAKHTYQSYINSTIRYIQDFLTRENVHSGQSTDYLRYLQQSYRPAGKYEPQSLDDTLTELKDVFLNHTVAYHSPNYLSHLNCPVVLPAIIGDLVASSVNTAIETWDQSTSGTLIEQEMVDWITSRVGLSDQADGVFTSGGSQSNFMALLLARDHFAYKNLNHNIKESGLNTDISKFRIFCSEKSHFSLQKGAAMLGLGYNSVIAVPTDDEMRMDTDALATLIEVCVNQGEIPIAVVATLGTTDFGSFDPLEDIAQITNQYGLWLHVDGAYGGCFALTDTHKHYFKGIKEADSMTVDFHKSFFQPVSSSALLLNNRDHFKYVSHHADYLNPLDTRDENMPNLIEKSIQTTRRFDALKLWFTLKMIGEEQIIQYLDQVHHLAVEVYGLAKEDDKIEFIHEPALSTLVFRYITPNVKDDTVHDTVNMYIKNELYNSGKISIASTRHDGNIYLKFTLLDPNMTAEHLLSVLDIIKSKGHEYQYKN